MIESLKIKNFQSHKEADLEFSSGVNAIVGPSDCGKTAILRALRWVVFNRPSGDAFRMEGTRKVSVALRTTEGFEIIREKDHTRNLYLLLSESGDSEFTAFGQSVTEEILRVLNLTRLNFQEQHDPPFLLSSSPGEVARHLNDLVNIDVIDSSQKIINREIRRIRNDISTSVERIEQMETEITEYDYLPELEGRIAELEGRQRVLEGMIRQRNKLSVLIQKYHDAANELEDFRERQKSLKKIEPHINNIIRAKEDRTRVREEREQLRRTLRKYRDTIDSLTEVTKENRELARQLREEMPNICPLCEQEVP